MYTCGRRLNQEINATSPDFAPVLSPTERYRKR